VLDESLRLLHPFIPFVTEETWGYLKEAAGGKDWPAGLMVAPWPQAAGRDLEAEADMGLVMELVRGIRNARAEYNVEPGKRIPALIAAADKLALLQDQAETLSTLARVDETQLTIAAESPAPSQALTLVAGSVTAYLPLAGLIDLTAERARLDKELAEVQAQIARSQSLLAGPFAQRAPAAVVQRERDKLTDLEGRAERLRGRIADLA
jgi:valyl-tRNA synthetase